MAIQPKSTIKTYFEAGDQPTCAQFVDLVDSYADRTSATDAFASAKAGLVEVQTTGSPYTVTARAALGTAMRTIVNANTTASAHSNLGQGAVGATIYDAATTASAHSNLGIGAVGQTLYDAITTASALSVIGDPGATEATTAQAQAGLAAGVYMSPVHLQHHPFGVRAYVNFTCAASIQISERVSSVTREQEGGYKIRWAPALPTADYAIACMTHSNAIAIGNDVCMYLDGSSKTTVSAADLGIAIAGGALSDPQDAASVVVFCSGD